MNRVTVQITASVEAVKTMVAAAVAENHAVSIVRMPEEPTPWFERHGKLTTDDAADLDASTYGVRTNANDIVAKIKAAERLTRFPNGGFVGAGAVSRGEKVFRR